MKTQHTKGPWAYSTGSSFDKPGVRAEIIPGNWIKIAECDLSSYRQALTIENETEGLKLVSENVEEANAKLISRAPEMLNLLSELSVIIKNNLESDGNGGYVMHISKEASIMLFSLATKAENIVSKTI